MPNVTVLEEMDFEDPKNFWTMNRKEPPKEFGVCVLYVYVPALVSPASCPRRY